MSRALDHNCGLVPNVAWVGHAGSHCSCLSVIAGVFIAMKGKQMISRPPNPLEQTAKDYLSARDFETYQRTQQQLVQAGVKAIIPLFDGLLVTLRGLKSLALGKQDVLDFINRLKKSLYPDPEVMSHLDKWYREVSAWPNANDGVSVLQIARAFGMCEKTWQVVSKIGESGIRELFVLVNNRRDSCVRLAVMLVLSMEKSPSRYILNSLATSALLLELPSDRVGEVASALALRMMILGGSKFFRERFELWIDTKRMDKDVVFDENIAGENLMKLAVFLLINGCPKS